MRAALLLFDRTAVLFLGVAAGAAIGYAFGVRQQTEIPVIASGPEVSAPIDTGANPPAVVPAGGKAPVTAPGTVPAAPPAVAETRPIQPGIVNAIAAGRPVRVGVFGDSFGDGIWSALYNQLSRKAGYQVIKYSQQATGFTRYKTLNLEDHDRARLAPAPVDIAVISFGANDMMGVADGGHVYALLTPNWKAAIARRVSSYVAMLRAQGAIVYWVGLPKMREASYDADVVRMNAFYRDLMAQLGVAFIETAPYSVDGAGRYAAYLADPATGKPILMRANDGIHMSMNGYIRITRGLAGRIRSYVDQARAQAGGRAPPPPMVAPALSPAPLVTPPPPPRPGTKSVPKLEDPLAGEPAKAPAESHLPPAKGAPADLLPPDIGSDDVAPDNGN
ncbi:SGNH/GDSL hydrolase family protein [Rhizorhabdus argentea]|uniref:SGNH/GDSL hydrolase family protein n=1 Tax=Rhizorhabdus argentea TaxID=1387174 RepID=UPI0030EF11AB